MRTRGLRWALAVMATGILSFNQGCSQRSDDAASVAAGTNAPVLIEPNVSVGKIRAGMTVRQAVAELGEAQRKTAHALEYTRWGLALLPGSDGVVQIVMCGDVTGINGPFVKAFTGRTKEGIGMKSTRAELVKAYGEPTSNQRFWGGFESMKYDSLGITFTLDGGKVCHMAVSLSGLQNPGQHVTVEIVPTQTQK